MPPGPGPAARAAWPRRAGRAPFEAPSGALRRPAPGRARALERERRAPGAQALREPAAQKPRAEAALAQRARAAQTPQAAKARAWRPRAAQEPRAPTPPGAERMKR